ncbi:MAG: SDR family oxidoreductase [Pelagibacterales bacterium]|nr:SDR family oxidoreductase [Pelagibacterales bacterium]
MIIFATGSSSSLAQEVLSSLSKKGYKIFGTYNKNKPKKLLKNKKIKLFKLDITSERQLKKTLKKVRLINKNITLLNFVVFNEDRLFVNENLKNINKNFQINIKSHINLVKTFLPIMIRNKFGRIIHFSSVIHGETGTSLYSASKSYLEGFSAVLAKEYAGFNITSNILSLGYFNYGLWDKLSAKLKKKRLDQIPSKKLGKPVNIANAIDFIIRSDYVNKSIIKVDGGI